MRVYTVPLAAATLRRPTRSDLFELTPADDKPIARAHHRQRGYRR